MVYKGLMGFGLHKVKLFSDPFYILLDNKIFLKSLESLRDSS